MAGDRILKVRLTGDSSGAVGAVGRLDGALGGISKKMLAVGAALGGMAAVGGVFADLARTGMAYEDTLNEMSAVTGATNKQMESIRETARELGSDLTLPATSAADATGSMLALAKGGFSVEESMEAARGSILLGAAAQIEGARAAEIQAAAINQFNLEAEDAERVTDVLANVANAASGSIEDVANALEYVGPVAKSFGLSVEDTAATLGVLAKNGILANKAGTSFRGILAGLANPSDKAAAALDVLNLEVMDAKGNFKGMRYVTKQLVKAKQNLTQAEFNQAAAAAFGREPLAAINALAQSGTTAHDEMAKAVRRQGTAAEIAAKKNEGFRGTLDRVRSQLEDLYITIWEKASPALQSLGDTAAKGIQGLNDALKNGITFDLSSALNNFDGAKAGKALKKWFFVALDNIQGVSKKIWETVKGWFASVNWLELGMEIGKMLIPVTVGIVTGLMESIGDPATYKPMLEHWDKILMALIGLMFAPAKLIKPLIKALEKIPFVGKFLSWFVKQLQKLGTKIKKGAKKLWKSFTKGWREGMERGGIVRAARQAIGRAWNAIKRKAGEIVRGLGRKAQEAAESFGRWLSRKGPKQARAAVSKIKDAIVRFMSRAGSWLLRHGGALIMGLVRGIGRKIGSVIRGIGRIKNTITGWFSTAGSWLFNSGASVISGFISGIRSMAGAVAGAVSGVVSKARDYLPFSPAKKGPFSGKGWTLYSGRSVVDAMAKGMRQRVRGLQSAAAATAKAARPSLSPLEGVRVSGSGRALRASGRSGVPMHREALYRASQGGSAAPVYVTVEVKGNVIGEQDFAERVTPTIRKELVKIGKRNGGDIFGRQ